jgi:hypothetical protein
MTDRISAMDLSLRINGEAELHTLLDELGFLYESGVKIGLWASPVEERF